LVLFFVALYLTEPTTAPWKQRLTAQTALSMGFMLLGYFIFTNNYALKFIRNKWTIAIATLGAFWIWSAFERPSIIWSWMTGAGDAYWTALIATILFIPSILWLGSKLSIYQAVLTIGANSKHIMMHHLFGFFLVNLVLSTLGYVSINDVDVFYIFKAQSMWPVYLIAAIAWSLTIANILNITKNKYNSQLANYANAR